MKLIVGLGNPDEQYAATRHNIGFLVLDHVAGQAGIALQKQGFESLYGRGTINGQAVILAQPQTYMNLSGIAVQRLFSYYRIADEDLIVIHDDLDLSFQTIRLKAGGGDGGHKGVISIATYLGSSDFTRIRIGIGKPARKAMVERYVLSPFSAEERKILPEIIAAAGEALREMITRGLQAAMCTYHGRIIGEPADLARRERAQDGAES
jgi:peptidyl-tRNA hydrolase, PTH1 family